MRLSHSSAQSCLACSRTSRSSQSLNRRLNPRPPVSFCPDEWLDMPPRPARLHIHGTFSKPAPQCTPKTFVADAMTTGKTVFAKWGLQAGMLLSSTRSRDGGSDATWQRKPLAALALLAGLLATGPARAHAALPTIEQGVAPVAAAIGSLLLAQNQPLPPSSPPPARPVTPSSPRPAAAPTASSAQPASSDEPIGNVATLTGTASVVRNQATLALKLKDDIYLNDVVVTFKDSTLGITFNDETTFNLTANASIAIDNYVYEDGGKQNSALFDVTKGTVAFVASAVARSGDMKITTPTATLGIRGTTGLVEVNGAGSGAHNIKLYPDPDGRVGHIDVSDRNGVRLGSLTQGSSGFTVRSGP